MSYRLLPSKTGTSIFIVFLLAGSALAQTENPPEIPFDVTTVVMEESDAVTQRIAMDMLIDALEARGGYRDENEGWLFLIGISVRDDLDYAALSVATLYRLPESIVQMGKESEAFYMKVSAEERASFASEGKEIRQYVSEEYMRQFADIQGNYVELVPKTELKKGIEEIVERFLDRHYGELEY